MWDKRRLTISLEPRDYEDLQVLAESQQRSLNWVVTQAIRRHLETIDAEQPDLLRRARQVRLPL